MKADRAKIDRLAEVAEVHIYPYSIGKTNRSNGFSYMAVFGGYFFFL